MSKLAMYAEKPRRTTLPQGADLSSAAQHSALKMNSSGQVILTTASSDIVVAFLESPAVGESATVGDPVNVVIDANKQLGIASAAISAGQYVTPSTTAGRLFGAATASSGSYIVGVAITAAAAAGDYFLFLPLNYAGGQAQ